MLVEGGLTGLVVVLLSYIYQLADPVPPQLSELSPQIQAWFRRGSLVDILDKKMFVLTQGQSHLVHIMKQWNSERYFLYIKYLPNSKIFQTSCSSIRRFSSLGIQYFFFQEAPRKQSFWFMGSPLPVLIILTWLISSQRGTEWLCLTTLDSGSQTNPPTTTLTLCWTRRNKLWRCGLVSE